MRLFYTYYFQIHFSPHVKSCIMNTFLGKPPFLSILRSGRGTGKQQWGVMGEVLGPSNYRATELLTTRAALSLSNTRVPGWHLGGLTSISVVNNKDVLMHA